MMVELCRIATWGGEPMLNSEQQWRGTSIRPGEPRGCPEWSCFWMMVATRVLHLEKEIKFLKFCCTSTKFRSELTRGAIPKLEVGVLIPYFVWLSEDPLLQATCVQGSDIT